MTGSESFYTDIHWDSIDHTDQYEVCGRGKRGDERKKKTCGGMSDREENFPLILMNDANLNSAVLKVCE